MREEFKIILKFSKEDKQINLSPMALPREVKKKLGEMEMAKISRVGNSLITCKTEEQKKVLHVEKYFPENNK